MRHYPDMTDESDIEDVKRLAAQDWQIECLKYNPDYCWWGIHEDYMAGKGEGKGFGWDQPKVRETWAAVDFNLDDLNEVVNFYFHVERAAVDCPQCGGSAYNPATHQISEGFYNFEGDRREAWNDKITQDEVDYLWGKGRLYDFNPKWRENQNNGVTPPTAEQVNEWQRKRSGHDAINRMYLIECRAKRLGVWGYCEHCEGHGHVFTEPAAHLKLTLWVLHPRKGCSRGVEVQHIEQEQLPSVFAYLQKAAQRNAERFGKLPIVVNE